MAIIYGRADSEMQLLKKYPRKVKTIEDIPRVYEEMEAQLKAEGSGFFASFRRWNKRRQIRKFERNENSSLHAGASGELQVLERLSRLNDDYHVLCGLHIELPNWVTYNGTKNLRSAQMDFVVVSKRGIVLIEVKNWSARYYNQNRNFGPYEQVDRAGMVLWIALRSWRSPKNPEVKKVLLSVQSHMRYNPKYKFVLVSNLNRINSFLEGERDKFSEKEVKRIVDRLKDYVSR